ncbi:phosphomethylpyrimidine synthase [Candidatus Methanosphaera massiliense]|uniref:phosphomethylpyrimidine synthase n=1 Tax=Methanosphaera TaxID=2316 RepID=UPI0023807B35|nr:phosphomethylpyrimidine synthase [Candidatus Methanosphaera massiliense]MDD6285553.1 phosphomethylpyrimidine synthase [Methanobacteriaceae archaeon]MDE4078189.1 phosphomethylpyrimidine synthase [Candidatus Methanosphaera massiliense]
MTQLEQARKGNITPEMEYVAKKEKIDIEKLRRYIASGKVVIPKNNTTNTLPTGIGKDLHTKINANIGSSTEMEDINVELEKLDILVKYGADAVMDLSTGPKLHEIRKAIRERTNIPLGTVPIYEAGVETTGKGKAIVDMDDDTIFNTIINQAKEGVDFITVHCGINQDSIKAVDDAERIMGIVSRGGALTAAWIMHNEKENPLYKEFDYLLEICREYDVTLSLGDGLRPGCTNDATDLAQIRELTTLGRLVKRSRAAGVQVMVEGPGHVPITQVKANMQIQKTICDGAPFYVLGPLVTDVAPGYDHITAAIGASIAGASGADFLCYVTPAEHLCIPNKEHVKQGVIASKIAAEVSDIAKEIPSTLQREKEMAIARDNFDWEKQFELAIDGETAREYYESEKTSDDDMCSMCGDFCAIKMIKDHENDNE